MPSLTVEGIGKKMPSWCNLLGLKGDFEKEYQFETLRIEVESASNELCAELKSKLQGDYTMLPKCGGACGSLRKKVNSICGDVFFFLSSGRKSIPKEERYSAIFREENHLIDHILISKILEQKIESVKILNPF